MTTQADIGYSATFKVGDGGSPETFTDFGVEVTSITLPSYSREAIDATHSASPDRYKEYIAGLMDAGEVSLDLNYVPDAADKVIAALEAGKQSYQIVLPGDDEVTLTFTAICTGYQPTAPIADKMTSTATFKISGKPVLSDNS
jgi:hypothetical protein